MNTSHRCKRIVLVPRNGYVNRLQAWASAAILAEALNCSLEILWDSERVAPVPLTDFIDPQSGHATDIDEKTLLDITGKNHTDLPRYLSLHPEQGFAFLAGHDRGEQFFMRELESALAGDPRLHTLVIVAGGVFHLPGEANFRSRRTDFYRHLIWNEQITRVVSHDVTTRGPYIALHVRQTDRAREAPTTTAMRKALGTVGARTGCANVFVAADSVEGRELGLRIAQACGLSAWTSRSRSLDRSTAEAALGAMIDWYLLSQACAGVYSSTSSFAHEAFVAGDALTESVALTAPPVLQATRSVRDVIRHGWLRMRPRSSRPTHSAR